MSSLPTVVVLFCLPDVAPSTPGPTPLLAIKHARIANLTYVDGTDEPAENPTGLGANTHADVFFSKSQDDIILGFEEALMDIITLVTPTHIDPDDFYAMMPGADTILGESALVRTRDCLLWTQPALNGYAAPVCFSDFFDGLDGYTIPDNPVRAALLDALATGTMPDGTTPEMLLDSAFFALCPQPDSSHTRLLMERRLRDDLVLLADLQDQDADTPDPILLFL